MLIYHVELAPDDNGTLLVSCPELPEVVTFGEDEQAALGYAVGAIEEALAARMAHKDEIPLPRKVSAGNLFPVRLSVQMESEIQRYRTRKW